MLEHHGEELRLTSAAPVTRAGGLADAA